MTFQTQVSWGAALLLLTASAVGGQENRPITGIGTEGFRALLAGKGLQPLGSIEELRRLAPDPGQVLIVSFRGADIAGNPHPDLLAQLPFEPFRDFVARGGALMVATDQQVEADWLTPFGAEVTGIPVRASPRGIGYRGNRECPFVAGVSGVVPDLFVARPVNGLPPEIAAQQHLTRVATNRPTYLKPQSQLTTLGVFPANSWQTLRENTYNPTRGAFVQGNRFEGGGRFLLLADHSVFINSMLLPRAGDNDNLQFAANCLDWLLINSTGVPRKYVLFIEDGRIWLPEDYNLMLQSLPLPPPEDLAQFLWDNRDLLWQNADYAETVLAAIEEEGIFSELEKSDPLGQIMRDLFAPWVMAKGVLIFGMIALLGYGIFGFMNSRFRGQRRTARLSLLLDRTRPRTGLIDLRLRSGLGKGQYYELARERARAMFADLNITPLEGTPLPPTTINTSWWQRGRIARDLRRVWAVAFGSEAVPINAREWEPFVRKLRQLSAMVENGTIRFE